MTNLFLVALLGANAAHYCGVDVGWDLLIGVGDKAAIIEFGEQFACGRDADTLICENGAEIRFEIDGNNAIVSYLNRPIEPEIVLPRCDYVPA